MVSIVFTKIGNIIRFILFRFLEIIISISSQKTNPKTLLIIRLDSIGDYLLVRNYFSLIKKNNRYQNHKITLCGNILWKDLAEGIDNNIFDEFIWLNRKKFNNNPFYKYKILKYVYKKGFESVIDTTFSREILFGDSIVQISRAKEKIGSIGSPDVTAKWKRNLLSDKYYTKIISQSSQNIFEFYRNKEFFEGALNEKIELSKPVIDCSLIEIELPTKQDFAVIFPGAQNAKRRWLPSNFEMIIDYLISKYNLDIIIAGSVADSSISQKIIKTYNLKSCFDMTGKTTLPQLAKLISISKILVSNETSSIHFAASTGTPFICISNGNHFGRFNPYPEEMNIRGRYVYPEEIEKNITDFEFLSAKYRFDSSLDINSIHSDRVKKVIDELL